MTLTINESTWVPSHPWEPMGVSASIQLKRRGRGLIKDLAWCLVLLETLIKETKKHGLLIKLFGQSR